MDVEVTKSEVSSAEITQPVDAEQLKRELEGYRNDMFKFKERAKLLEEENASIKKQAESDKLKKLEEKENYKELYAHLKQQNEEIVSQKTKLENYLVDSKRLEAVKSEALRAGIKEEALNDLDLIDSSMVVVERTDRGNMHVIGAKDFVDGLKKVRPFWFNDGIAPKVNSAPPGKADTSTQVLSPKEILALQKSNPEAYAKYVLKHKGRL